MKVTKKLRRALRNKGKDDNFFAVLNEMQPLHPCNAIKRKRDVDLVTSITVNNSGRRETDTIPQRDALDWLPVQKIPYVAESDRQPDLSPNQVKTNLGIACWVFERDSLTTSEKETNGDS